MSKKVFIEHTLSIMRICYNLEENSEESAFISFDYNCFNVILHFSANIYSKIEFTLLNEADKEIPAFIWKNLVVNSFKVTKKKTIIGQSIESMNKTIDGVRAAEDSLVTSINAFEEKLREARSLYINFKQSLVHADEWMEKRFKKNYSPYCSFNISKYSTFIDMDKETYKTMFNTEIKDFIGFKMIILTLSDTQLKVKIFRNMNQSNSEMGDYMIIENTELKNIVDKEIEKFLVLEIDTISKVEEEEEKNKNLIMIRVDSYHPAIEINPSTVFFH